MEEQLRVLVVDDDPDILYGTARIIEKEGLLVFKAVDGNGCLEAFKEHMPHIVLLDIILPDISGMELCREIKEKYSDIDPLIILLSGKKTDDESKTHGFAQGADGFLSRPINNAVLRSYLRAFVRIKQNDIKNKKLITELAKKNRELQEAQKNIKILGGLIPICSSCKKIRDDKGFWEHVETYISNNSEASFTHGICPECTKKIFSELNEYE